MGLLHTLASATSLLRASVTGEAPSAAATRTDSTSVHDWEPGQSAQAPGIPATAPIDLLHRITWGIAQDALSPGYRVDRDAEEGEEAEDAQDITRDLDTSLKLRERVLKAYATARRERRAYLWLVERGANHSEPLEGPVEIVAVHVVRAREAIAYKWETDPEETDWLRPTHYRVTVTRAGGRAAMGSSVEVHASRLLAVDGAPCTPGEEDGDGAGPSAAELYLRAMCGYDLGYVSAADLMERRAQPTLELNPSPEAQRNVAGKGARSRIHESLNTWWEGMSGPGRLGVLMNGDKLVWTGPPVSGTAELLTQMAVRMSPVEGLSQAGIWGTPPGGLSSDDAAGKRADARVYKRIQRTVFTPLLERVHDAILGEDPSRRYEWGPIDEPDELQLATISEVLMRRDTQAVAAGIISEDEARARHADGEEVREYVLQDEGVETDPAELLRQMGMDPTAMLAGPAHAAEAPEVPQAVAPSGVPVEKVQDTALNGSQVSSAVEIVQGVTANTIASAGARAMLRIFFNLSDEQAGQLLEGADQVSPPQAAAPPPPAAGAPDGPPSPPDET